MTCPPVIIGAGLAGLTLALSLAPKPVIVIGRKPLHDLTSSELAQGGIAAAMSTDDNPQIHAKDTVVAGAMHCDEQAVKAITDAAPDAIRQLEAWGVRFDQDEKGLLDLGLEGAHVKRRIVHAKGDSTGAVIMQALVEKVKATPSIMLIDGEATHIEKDTDGAVSGVSFYDVLKEQVVSVETQHVILATGSAAALWQHTTVPSHSWGSGILLAVKAGAAVKDLEFAQFHPTALDVGLDPMPLVSEAVRGEGALLVNDLGEAFVQPLAPRDVVARAVWAQLDAGRSTYVDARLIDGFANHFPTVYNACHKSGIDPELNLIPIKPVTHYHMGGIVTNLSGQTDVAGLWACGECACTGLHGANRLASNSLLEAVVMGKKIASVLHKEISLDAQASWKDPAVATYHQDRPEDIKQVRSIMSRYVGVCRSQRSLEQAVEELTALAPYTQRAQIACLIAQAALRRPFSLGAHERIDTSNFSRRLAS